MPFGRGGIDVRDPDLAEGLGNLGPGQTAGCGSQHIGDALQDIRREGRDPCVGHPRIVVWPLPTIRELYRGPYWLVGLPWPTVSLDSDRAAQFNDCLVATPADIARAKTLVLAALSDRARSVDDLRQAVLDPEGINLSPDHRGEEVNMPWPDDPEWRPDRHHRAIARIRLVDAADEALAQLAQSGVLVERGEISNSYKTVSIQRARTRFGHRMFRPQAALAQSYERSRRDGLEPALLDVDIFTADLAELGLNFPTLRCLEEALRCYRHQLYLSCVNLLGATSEGAWYAAGEELRPRSSALAKALDNDQTAKVIELTAQLLAAAKGTSAITVRELQTHAAYLRDLRNYGVHPRGEQSEDQEQAFTDHGTGLIVLQTHRYLSRLRDTVVLVRASYTTTTDAETPGTSDESTS